MSPQVEVIIVDNKRRNKIVENQIKFIDVVKEWMHGWMMENVQKIKIKLENIWIDLIRSIYAPYNSYSMGITQQFPQLFLLYTITMLCGDLGG